MGLLKVDCGSCWRPGQCFGVCGKTMRDLRPEPPMSLGEFVRSPDEARGRVYDRVIPQAIEAQRQPFDHARQSKEERDRAARILAGEVERLKALLSRVPKGYPSWSWNVVNDYKAAARKAGTVANSARPVLLTVQTSIKSMEMFFKGEG